MNASSSNRKIGVVFDSQNIYERMSARDNLRFFARLYRVKKVRVEEVLAQVGLLGRARDKMKTYSNGMKQCLLIARALLHKPKVLFLDEPTKGLDPQRGPRHPCHRSRTCRPWQPLHGCPICISRKTLLPWSTTGAVPA